MEEWRWRGTLVGTHHRGAWKSLFKIVGGFFLAQPHVEGECQSKQPILISMFSYKSSPRFPTTQCAILAAALLLGAWAPNSVAAPPGVLISSGNVTGGPSVAIPLQAPGVSLQYSLYLQPDGTPKGRGTLTSADGSVEFDLTSYVIMPPGKANERGALIEGALAAAGPATKVTGSPKFGPDGEGASPHIVAVGETMFFYAYDLSNGNSPDAFLEGKVPFFVPAGPGGMSIQDIIPQAPAARSGVCRVVLTGDLAVAKSPGTLIGSGLITGGPFAFLPLQATNVTLQYSLYLQPDGTPKGRATLSSAKGSVDFDLTSYVAPKNGILEAAGPAIAVRGSPSFGPDSEGPSPHIIGLGEILFFYASDQGLGGSGDAFSEGKVPFFLNSADFDTIQKIDVVVGVPPINLMRQALAGDISFSSPPGTLVGSGQATMGPSPALTNQVAGVSIMFSLSWLFN